MTTKTPIEILANIDAERGLIGAILTDPSQIDFLPPSLSRDDFYDNKLAALFDRMISMRMENRKIDIVTLSHAGFGPDWLFELYNSVDNPYNADGYAEIVKDLAMRRRLLQASSDSARHIFNFDTPIEEIVGGVVSQMTGIITGIKGSVVPVDNIAGEFIDNLLEADQEKRSKIIVPTGFTDIDRFLSGGLRRSKMAVLSARTSEGKTAWASGMIYHVAVEKGMRVVWFSLEMTNQEVMTRLISGKTKIPFTKIEQPWLMTDEERTIVMAEAAKISQAPLFIDDAQGISPAIVAARARQISAMYGPIDLLVVDHLHIMSPSDRHSKSNDAKIVSDMAVEMANYCKELACAGLILCQMGRDVSKRAIKRPTLSDLKESSGIEQNADRVFFTYRPGLDDPTYSKHEAVFIVAKNRNGPTGDVQLFWDAEFASYRDADMVSVDTGERLAMLNEIIL